MSEPCWNVVAVNRDKGLAVVETGGEYPITKYLDANGDECAEAEAIMAIAGFDYTWLWIDLRDFDGARQ